MDEAVWRETQDGESNIPCSTPDIEDIPELRRIDFRKHAKNPNERNGPLILAKIPFVIDIGKSALELFSRSFSDPPDHISGYHDPL